MPSRPALVAAVLVTTLARADAQTPRFDVTSIKRNVSGDPAIVLDISRGQVRAVNLPIHVLIRQAFDVMDSQIVNAPQWATNERYDINAKAPQGVVTAEAMRPLLRELLADRFALVTHRETREMPVFALVWSRADRRFGPSLRDSPLDCAGGRPPTTRSAAAGDEDWPDCSVKFTPGSLYIGGYRIAEFTRMLTPLVGRTIIDETSLTGRVKVRVDYRPQERAGAAADDRPDLFAAIEEQTGLKLEGRRAQVEVLVIDRLERPTAD
jgi:uncharacterized protein (TIGR03435 family)